jgi:hypothetical protein
LGRRLRARARRSCAVGKRRLSLSCAGKIKFAVGAFLGCGVSVDFVVDVVSGIVRPRPLSLF